MGGGGWNMGMGLGLGMGMGLGIVPRYKRILYVYAPRHVMD